MLTTRRQRACAATSFNFARANFTPYERQPVGAERAPIPFWITDARVAATWRGVCAQPVSNHKQTSEHAPAQRYLARRSDSARVRSIGVCNFSAEQIDEAAEALESHGLAQVAINWLLTTPGIDALPIPGIRTVKQAADNIGAVEWRMSAEERQLICAAEEQSRSPSFSAARRA